MVPDDEDTIVYTSGKPAKSDNVRNTQGKMADQMLMMLLITRERERKIETMKESGLMCS